MSFSPDERRLLLSLKGIGPKVVERLEQMGLHTLQQLADADAADILARGALLSGSSCWKNSPQARSAIQAAIGAAVAQCADTATRRPHAGPAESRAPAAITRRR